MLKATDKLKILSLDDAFKLKLTKKPEFYKIQSQLSSPVLIPYPVCEETICKGKKLLVFNQDKGDEYYCNNVTSYGKCSFRTKTPKFNNRLEIDLVDPVKYINLQIPATAIGKIADSIFEKIKTHQIFILTVKASITDFQVKKTNNNSSAFVLFILHF